MRDNTAEKCCVCGEDAGFMVSGCKSDMRDIKPVYFCESHLPQFNAKSDLIRFEIHRMYLTRPLGMSGPSFPASRNPITCKPAGVKIAPKVTPTMRAAMIRLMRKQGFFNAAQVLTLGANEEDRLEVLRLAMELDREEANNG